MDFFSHAKKENGIKIGSKLLRKHLDGVYQKAISSNLHTVNFDLSVSELRQIVKDIAYFHDLGKYTSYFQNYLLGKKTDAKLKNHARIGAFAILNKQESDPIISLWKYFIILKHHSSFDDIETLDLTCGDFPIDKIENFLKQVKDIEKHISQISTELSEPNLSSLLEIPETKTYRKALKAIIRKTPDPKHYFFVNYLFSLLTESDKLDASDTIQYERKPISEDAVEKYIGAVSLDNLPQIEKISGFEQNMLRNYVRAAILENLKQPDILNQYLFTLTAPTGIGKTLASLDFALRLKKMISEKENHEPQIIYGLPFINIIEQGLKVYSKEVFSEEIKNKEINILAHYQYADVFGKQDNKEEKLNYDQKLMELNTWQSDIIITSFVQFFETVVSNRNKMILKFNHLAGAIVILDEVQTLQLQKLPFIGAVLFYLSKFLHTRLILMTATKPKIFELANSVILEKENEKAVPLELLKENEQIFAKFNRTKLVPLIDTPIVKNDDFYSLFSEKRTKEKSCLIVCNTVQRSIDVFKVLRDKKVSPLYYLSTNIVPAVRLDIIQKIRTDLENGKYPVLVSTQVVEAGVDLDFDMGFRDLAPIDSIVQVAGRINRENSKNRENSPLYIVEFEKENGSSECQLVYDTLTQTQVVNALKDKPEIYEKDYLSLINDYFSVLSDKSAFDDSVEFFEALKKLKYKTKDSKEKAVNKFKIIDEANYAVSVFVELNDSAKQARLAYYQLLTGDLKKEQFDRNFKKTFNQYIIAVPEKFAGDLENLNEFSENIKLVRNSDLKNYYDLETGYIREVSESGRMNML